MRTKSYSKKQILSLIALPFAASVAAAMITVPSSALAFTSTVNVSSATTFDLTGGDMLTVLNSGTINAFAQSDHAIDISGSTNTVYNAGDIIGAPSYYAIFANGDSETTIINAQATATPTGTPMISVSGGRAIAFGDDLDSNSSITNAGIIQAGSSQSTTDFAVGISVYGGEIEGTIDNSGTISASATTSDNFAVAVGIYGNGNLDGSIDNSGTINAHVSATTDTFAFGLVNGIWLDDGYGSGDANGILTNSGDITATGNATASYGDSNIAIGLGFGVNVDYLSGELTNEYGGGISADVDVMA